MRPTILWRARWQQNYSIQIHFEYLVQNLNSNPKNQWKNVSKYSIIPNTYAITNSLNYFNAGGRIKVLGMLDTHNNRVNAETIHENLSCQSNIQSSDRRVRAVWLRSSRNWGRRGQYRPSCQRTTHTIKTSLNLVLLIYVPINLMHRNDMLFYLPCSKLQSYEQWIELIRASALDNEKEGFNRFAATLASKMLTNEDKRNSHYTIGLWQYSLV